MGISSRDCREPPNNAGGELRVTAVPQPRDKSVQVMEKDSSKGLFKNGGEGEAILLFP